MNLSNQVQIIYVPWWLRLTILLTLLAATVICSYMLVEALARGGRSDWIQAATYLFGIIFPFIILFAVVAGSSNGEAAIRRRTEYMLTNTLPYTFQFIPEEKRNFRDYGRAGRSPRTASGDLATCRLHHSRGRCYADYLIALPATEGAPAGEISLRVELNVKRVNVNFVFPTRRVSALKALAGSSADDDAFIRSQFPHSLAVERMQAAARKEMSEDESTRKSTAYAFNPQLIHRVVDGEACCALVATTSVSDDMVWNPAERVFFAQDLMFMIRAFWQECPALFAPARDGEAPPLNTA